jgi:hypothetical protein
MTTPRVSTGLLALVAAFVAAGCSPDRGRRRGDGLAAVSSLPAGDVGSSAGLLARARLNAALDEIDRREAEAAALTARVVDVRRELADARLQVDRLTTLNVSLEADVTDLRAELTARLRDRPEGGDGAGTFSVLVPDPPVPAIDGAVVGILPGSPGLVLLSVGADDKVESGYQLSVYRGSQFVGKVVAESVRRDDTGCRVMFLADHQEIRPGDRAATRLQ